VYSILHLSDLHRSPDEPIDNSSLVAALLADRDRYVGETPVVPSPDAIIVSGDLIQGARLGDPNWQEAVADQYACAREFLDLLANRFLGGDRSRLVIIPGNHDVCWNTSLSSMERVDTKAYPRRVYDALAEPESQYRWSWEEQALYRIADPARYAQRLAAYWDFADAFYQDVKLPLPIDRSRSFQLFELDNRRIAVATFDSTRGNDCFGYSGALVPGAVGKFDLHLRDASHNYAMRMAVWHHNLHGPPARNDYMDIAQVHEMAGLKFQLGLHGHQHVAQATTHYVHLGDSRSMAVVSAGSLCAGARELPRGVDRQYNVIVVNDDYLGARVHVREMTEGLQFTRKRSGAFGQGFVEVNWQPITDAQGRTVDPVVRNEHRVTFEAEEALQTGNPNKALLILASVDLSRSVHGRAIAIQAALKVPDWSTLLAAIGQPRSNDETIWKLMALINKGHIAIAERELAEATELDKQTRGELEAQIGIKKALRSP
jgi:hypothetical protein